MLRSWSSTGPIVWPEYCTDNTCGIKHLVLTWNVSSARYTHGEVTMRAFTEKETEYLRGQRLGRLATVGPDGSPHVIPVGFRLDAEARVIEVGGHRLSGSKKWRDLKGNPRIALVVDDLASVDPWTPRGIEVRGRAELHSEGGAVKFGPQWDAAWIRIVPQRIVSWGIEGPAFSATGRRARSVPQV